MAVPGPTPTATRYATGEDPLIRASSPAAPSAASDTARSSASASTSR